MIHTNASVSALSIASAISDATASSLAVMARLPSQEPAFYAREYNNRALVPDHAVNLARWGAMSTEVRARGGVREDLPYGDPGSPYGADERLDYFAAHGSIRPPLVVFVHGGYWRALDKRDHSFVANALPSHGVSVAVINYTLCPAVSVETIVRQGLGSVAWLYRNASKLGHDPARIFVAGHSAGGHFAAMAMAARWPEFAPDLPVDLVKGALSISGLYDLEPLRRADFLQVDLRLSSADVARLSPAFLPAATAAPLVTAVGGLESSEYHRQNALIRAAWPANANAVALGAADVPMPGTHHFSVLEALADADSALFKSLLKLVNAPSSTA